jgi:hypothetical protein
VPLKLSAKSKLSFMMSRHSANKVQRPHISRHNLTDNNPGHLILDPVSGLLHDPTVRIICHINSTEGVCLQTVLLFKTTPSHRYLQHF